jgi:hypothetical protein
MQPDTYCNVCLSPLALCPCYSKLSQRMPPPDFAALEIGTSERPVVASPQYQHLLAIHTPFHFMPDLLSGTYYAVDLQRCGSSLTITNPRIWRGRHDQRNWTPRTATSAAKPDRLPRWRSKTTPPTSSHVAKTGFCSE